MQKKNKSKQAEKEQGEVAETEDNLEVQRQTQTSKKAAKAEKSRKASATQESQFFEGLLPELTRCRVGVRALRHPVQEAEGTGESDQSAWRLGQLRYPADVFSWLFP